MNRADLPRPHEVWEPGPYDPLDGAGWSPWGEDDFEWDESTDDSYDDPEDNEEGDDEAEFLEDNE